jgi:hypothetical protein
MKAQWTAEIDLLIGHNVLNAKALLEQLKQDLIEQMRPVRFNENDPNSVIHRREESFERLCFNMRKNNISHPENLSTYAFYATVQMIKEEQELKTRQNL